MLAKTLLASTSGRLRHSFGDGMSTIIGPSTVAGGEATGPLQQGVSSETQPCMAELMPCSFLRNGLIQGDPGRAKARVEVAATLGEGLDFEPTRGVCLLLSLYIRLVPLIGVGVVLVLVL